MQISIPFFATFKTRINFMHPEASLSLIPLKENKPLFLRTEMDRLLTLSMVFSCLLVGARMLHTGRITFLSMVWNLFLAYVPYFITTCLSRRPQWVTRKPLFTLFFIAWLLFIPNSFYIITDLFHLGDHSGAGLTGKTALSRANDRQAPQWLDLALIFSFAWNGLLLGVLSVRQMEKIMEPFLPARHDIFFLYPVMWLNALGVYTGRYLRYNSWDVITNPFQLFWDIAGMITHPLRNQYAWDMIFCFFILMTLMYLMLKRISKALA
jgi:uncharacterized membrane protein